MEKLKTSSAKMPVSPVKVFSGIILALITGFLLGLSFPESGKSAYAFIAMIPLLLTIRNKKPKSAFAYSYIAGFCFFAVIYQWGFVFGMHVFLAMVIWQSFYFGLWGGILAWLLYEPDGQKKTVTERIFLTAASWVCYEYLRTLGPLGINWGALAYSQFKWLTLIQISGITGMFGVSFLIMLVNSVVSEITFNIISIRERADLVLLKNVSLIRNFLLTLTLFLIVLTYGYIKLGIDDRQKGKYISHRMAAVQPNMDMGLKWNRKMLTWTFSVLENYSRQAAVSGARIIFWPETAVTTYFPNNPHAKARVEDFSRSCGAFLLIGAPEMKYDGSVLNSVFLISPSGQIIDKYSKIHIVAFGEYLPLSKYLRKYTLFDRVQNFSPGDRWKVFNTPFGHFSVLICFESDFPGIARRNIQNGAQFLAVVTNDAWFELTSAASHHISWDVFRAVENHSNVIQAGNTGICAFIDYNGRIKSKSSIFTRTVVVGEIALAPVGTFYTYYGDIICYISIALVLLMVFLRLKQMKTLKSGLKTGDGRRKGKISSKKR